VEVQVTGASNARSATKEPGTELGDEKAAGRLLAARRLYPISAAGRW
jgi:hypothetical protein